MVSGAGGRAMTPRLRDVSMYLFVLAEAVAWFAVLRALGTAVVRGAFDRLATQVAPAASFPGNGRAPEALAIARDGAEHAVGGPSFLVVVVAAFAAFLLVRALAEAGFPLPLNAAVGLAASLVVLQVLVHVAVYDNVRVWEQSALGAVLDSTADGVVDATSFIADPNPDLVKHDSMLIVSVVGLTLLWVRFLVAGRAPVTYERALRSFTIGFGVVLLAAIVGGGVGTDAPAFAALAYFVLGALSLAAAHLARTRTSEDALGRDAPVALAAVTTLGVIVVAALLFGLLAALDVQRAFDPMFDIVLTVIGRVMFVLLTPIFWAVNWVLTHVLGSSSLDFPEQFRRFGDETVQPSEEKDGRFLPGWAVQAVRVLAVAAAVWLLYRASRLLFNLTRSRDLTEEREELRTTAARGGGFGSLLQGLFGGRTQTGWSGGWLRRHAVYRLYARLVIGAHDRGVERGQGDTPIEFAQRAGIRLDAAPFEPIGLAFDAARYGRHYPSKESLESLERDLRAWEQTHPPAPPGGGTPAG